MNLEMDDGVAKVIALIIAPFLVAYLIYLVIDIHKQFLDKKKGTPPDNPSI